MVKEPYNITIKNFVSTTRLHVNIALMAYRYSKTGHLNYKDARLPEYAIEQLLAAVLIL